MIESDRPDRRWIAIGIRESETLPSIPSKDDLRSSVSFRPRDLGSHVSTLAVYSLASGNYAKRDANFQSSLLSSRIVISLAYDTRSWRLRSQRSQRDRSLFRDRDATVEARKIASPCAKLLKSQRSTAVEASRIRHQEEIDEGSSESRDRTNPSLTRARERKRRDPVPPTLRPVLPLFLCDRWKSRWWA